MKHAMMMMTLLAAGMVSGGELNLWKYDSERDLMGDRMIFYAAQGLQLSKSIVSENTPDGGNILKITINKVAPDSPAHAMQIIYLYPGKLEQGKNYRLSFQYKGSQPGNIQMILAFAGSPHTQLAPNVGRTLPVTTAWQTFTLDFTAEKVTDNGYALPRLMVASYPEGGELCLGPVTLADLPQTSPAQ